MTNQNPYNPEIQGELAPDAAYEASQHEGSLDQIANQYDALVNQAFGQQQVEQTEHVADKDLEIQAGPSNQVLDSEGRQISKKDEDKRDELAEEVTSLEVQEGDELRIRRLARSMRAVTEGILKEQGIEPLTNVGQGKETAEMTLIADNVQHMVKAGGAKELDPTATKQIERITNQDIGLEAVRVVDKDPSKLAEIYEDDPDKARAAAKVVSLYRQNGSVNHRTSEALGRKLRGSSDSSTDLSKAA
jgi:hypothetical protein